MGLLKRTSSAAGLSQGERHCTIESRTVQTIQCILIDSEILSTTKRQLARVQHELEELRHSNERQLLEANSAQHALQNQVTEYALRVERLEKSRAILVGKEKESEEREKERKIDSDKFKADMQSQNRSLRQELSEFKDKFTTLSSTHRDLQHSSGQTTASSRSEAERADRLEEELCIVREEKAESEAQLLEARERTRIAEVETEKAKALSKDTSSADVIREELRRKCISRVTVFDFTASCLTRRCPRPGQSPSYVGERQSEAGTKGRDIRPAARQCRDLKGKHQGFGEEAQRYGRSETKNRSCRN